MANKQPKPAESPETNQTPEKPKVILVADFDGSAEMLAKILYGNYCIAVGGKSFNGEPLPDPDTFFANSESLPVIGWLAAAEAGKDAVAIYIQKADEQKEPYQVHEISLLQAVEMTKQAFHNDSDIALPKTVGVPLVDSLERVSHYLQTGGIKEDDLPDFDDDDFSDDDEPVTFEDIKDRGLLLDKEEAMQIQSHVTRIAMHGNHDEEIIRFD